MMQRNYRWQFPPSGSTVSYDLCIQGSPLTGGGTNLGSGTFYGTLSVSSPNGVFNVVGMFDPTPPANGMQAIAFAVLDPHGTGVDSYVGNFMASGATLELLVVNANDRTNVVVGSGGIMGSGSA